MIYLCLALLFLLVLFFEYRRARTTGDYRSKVQQWSSSIDRRVEDLERKVVVKATSTRASTKVKK